MQVSNKHPNSTKKLLALTVVLNKVKIWPQRPRTKRKTKNKKTLFIKGSIELLEPEATKQVVLQISSNHLWQKIK